jgi:tRNA 2-thiouridine synthesizing protein E
LKRVSIRLNGRLYRLDDRGFLNPPGQWDENFAEGLAERLQLPGGLTEEHWAFLRYLRDVFHREGTVPAVFHACADNRLPLRRFRALFPEGYLRGACRMAGVNFAAIADTALWLSYEHIPVIE